MKTAVDRIIKETREAREADKWVTVDIAILVDEVERLREALNRTIRMIGNIEDDLFQLKEDIKCTLEQKDT